MCFSYVFSYLYFTSLGSVGAVHLLKEAVGSFIVEYRRPVTSAQFVLCKGEMMPGGEWVLVVPPRQDR